MLLACRKRRLRKISRPMMTRRCEGSGHEQVRPRRRGLVSESAVTTAYRLLRPLHLANAPSVSRGNSCTSTSSIAVAKFAMRIDDGQVACHGTVFDGLKQASRVARLAVLPGRYIGNLAITLFETFDHEQTQGPWFCCESWDTTARGSRCELHHDYSRSSVEVSQLQA